MGRTKPALARRRGQDRQRGQSSVGAERDFGVLLVDRIPRNMTASLPSATKILQPNDSHILQVGDYVHASGVAPNSDYLFEAKRLLDR